MLNWNLLSHPLNWITVLLMVFIGLFVVNLLTNSWHGPQSATSKLGN